MRSYAIWSLVILPIAFFSCKDDRGLVVGRIHKASKLATTEFTIDKIVYGTETKRVAWVFEIGKASFIAHSKAIIKTGVDLQKLGKEDIEIDGGSIALKLPPVEVINFSYPPESFEIDNELSRRSLFAKIDVKEQEKFFREAEIDIRNNLKYMGVVRTTQEKTRSMLNVMLRSLGYEEIYIQFKSDSLLIDEVPDPREAADDDN